MRSMSTTSIFSYQKPFKTSSSLRLLHDHNSIVIFLILHNFQLNNDGQGIHQDAIKELNIYRKAFWRLLAFFLLNPSFSVSSIISSFNTLTILDLLMGFLFINLSLSFFNALLPAYFSLQDDQLRCSRVFFTSYFTLL